jgi:hypothetical protein
MVLAIGGALVLFIVPIFAVLSVYGVRKYLVNAKNAEARSALAEIAKDAARTYDPKRGFCPSASAPVPSSAEYVSAQKYQSAPAEWNADKATNAGFACLGFSMSGPQYYQYSYTGTADGFLAMARGDLDGDGERSTFSVRGNVANGHVEIAASVDVQSGEE